MPEDTGLPVSSSAEPEIHRAQEKLYRDVLRVLIEHRIPHAVSGAIALQKHTGVCRPTKDLDIFLTAESASIALAQLSQAGFHCEVCDPVWLAKVHRDGFFVDFITGMSNATISVTDAWMDRAGP